MNVRERTILFLSVCIPVRILIAVFTHIWLPDLVALVSYTPWVIRLVFSAPYILIGLGFVRTTILNNQVGCFGGNAWWALNRPYHALLWCLAAVLIVWGEYTAAAVILYCDVVIGLVTRYFAVLYNNPFTPLP